MNYLGEKQYKVFSLYTILEKMEMADIYRMTFEEIKARLDKLERMRQKNNEKCLDYYHEHQDRMREYGRKKAKEYYDKRKDDPSFREKNRLKTQKQNEKKKTGKPSFLPENNPDLFDLGHS